MLINRANLETIFEAFNVAYMKGFSGAPTAYKDISMVVPSTTDTERFGWLGQFPKMREWVGDRVVKNLTAHTFSIKNKLFESTVSLDRKDVEDDRYGLLAPVMTEMGKSAAEHPDELIFSLLPSGFSTTCYDGQNFFDTDHPVRDSAGVLQPVSNMQAGTDPTWYLLDCSRAVKPFVF